MGKTRHKLLVAQTANRREEFEPLERYADIYWLPEMDEAKQARVLPLIDCIYSHGWPKGLDAAKVSSMKSLRFYQAGNAGVNGSAKRAYDGRRGRFCPWPTAR